MTITAINSFVQNLSRKTKTIVIEGTDLLGHSSLKYVEVYVRAVDEEKKKALNSLPKLDIL